MVEFGETIKGIVQEETPRLERLSPQTRGYHRDNPQGLVTDVESPYETEIRLRAGRFEGYQTDREGLAAIVAQRGSPLGYVTLPPSSVGAGGPQQIYYEEDFLNYVGALDINDQTALAQGMYAQGLYGSDVDIADIMDPLLMTGALQSAVNQAAAYAQLFQDTEMIPTLEYRFAAYKDMTPQEIMAEFIRRGGGGRGGGRAIRLPDPAALRDTLEAASSQVLGRKATDAEKRMFVEGINSAVRAGESVDVGARAGVFARQQAPVEAGAMDLKNAGNLVLRALGLG